MKNRIITISREFGSGGRTVGKQAAQKLSIPCYDQELIEKIAEESGFAPAYIKEQGEYVVRAGWLSNALAGRFSNGLTTQDQLWLLQRKVILELAEKGPCVIVGRCADDILKEGFDILTVFMHAPDPVRIERVMKEKNISEKEAAKLIKLSDKRRSKHYEHYTGRKWGSARNYNLCIDGGRIGPQTAAKMIISAIK